MKKKNEKSGQECPKVIEIMDHLIDLSRLTNPQLISAIRNRRKDFLFSYGDHSDYSDYNYTCAYGDHTKTHTDEYSDYSD